MSERIIDPKLKNVSAYIDEYHWAALAELAAEKRVSTDFMLGVILEYSLLKLGKIEVSEPKENPLKVEITLEPVREDAVFLDALVTERTGLEADQKVADAILGGETSFDWHNL